MPIRATSRPSSGPARPRRLLRLQSSNLDGRARHIIHQVLDGLPDLSGRPIFVSARPHLKACGGKLVSGPATRGTPVHAASFIRNREIILETQLLTRPHKLRLIVAHEIFHFIWARLGNRRRAEFTALIQAELDARARGELGESAQTWKTTHLKTYVCESFCDTGAWLYSGVRQSTEFTLAERWRKKRRLWFQSLLLPSQSIAC